MALQALCDNHDCPNRSRVDAAGNPIDFGWVTMTENATKKVTHHYCGYSCAHKHTYLLISGDNGK